MFFFTSGRPIVIVRYPPLLDITLSPGKISLTKLPDKNHIYGLVRRALNRHRDDVLSQRTRYTCGSHDRH